MKIVKGVNCFKVFYREFQIRKTAFSCQLTKNPLRNVQVAAEVLSTLLPNSKRCCRAVLLLLQLLMSLLLPLLLV
jgi:hypothetical protein